MTKASPQDNRLPPARRLHGRSAFGSVYAHRLRKHAGALTVYGLPNGLPYGRLGLSVGRRVGAAVVRSRVKRMLREAFRLTQNTRPAGYDLIVVVKPHQPVTLDDYRRWLCSAAEAIDRQCGKRSS